MTPKEEAQVITAKFACLRLGEDFNKWGINICISEVDKQCALITVAELIKSWNEDFYEDCGASEYWQDVKNEIEKL